MGRERQEVGQWAAIIYCPLVDSNGSALTRFSQQFVWEPWIEQGSLHSEIREESKIDTDSEPRVMGKCQTLNLFIHSFIHYFIHPTKIYWPSTIYQTLWSKLGMQLWTNTQQPPPCMMLIVWRGYTENTHTPLYRRLGCESRYEGEKNKANRKVGEDVRF